MAGESSGDLARVLEHLSSSVSTLEFSVDQIERFSLIISHSSTLKRNLRLKNIILKPNANKAFDFWGDESRLKEMEKDFKEILGYSDDGKQVVGKEGRVTIDIGRIGTYQKFNKIFYVLAEVPFPAVELGGSSMLEDDDAFASRREVRMLADEDFSSLSL